MIFHSKQIPVADTLDVEQIERELTALWVQMAQGLKVSGEREVWRTRVANLVIFSSQITTLNDLNAILAELSLIHPCRALIVSADNNAPDHDIDVNISSLCQDEGEASTRLCCEAISLRAAGKFVPELPSATLPLLIPDLPVFLWWDEIVKRENVLFGELSRASDRLVIDSWGYPSSDLQTVAQLCEANRREPVGLTDINWARLTSWRALLASFYDVQMYRSALESVESLNIDYVATDPGETSIAPQALLIFGWLTSRLGWQPIPETKRVVGPVTEMDLKKAGSQLKLTLKRVDNLEIRPGRLSRVELKSKNENAVFVVERSANGSHIEANANIGGEVHHGQLLPVRNRSLAQLLGREMEILRNDDIYAAAIAVVTAIS